jgi:hypothetical protein
MIVRSCMEAFLPPPERSRWPFLMDMRDRRSNVEGRRDARVRRVR